MQSSMSEGCGEREQALLLNRRFLVGICGGIASYKAVELVSRLQQSRAMVAVIMSECVEEFVRSLTFSTVSYLPGSTALRGRSGRAAGTNIPLRETSEL